LDQTKSYPSQRYAWFLVVLLTIAYVLSFIDRYILGLLVEPIKADLGFTDTQIGLLMGPAFGFVYAVGGLFLGWLADHKRRTLVVAVGVGVWSLATAMTGLAKSFLHVFLARMSVGIGEASLSPSAMSMIKDSFAPENRGKPIAFYTAALSLGAGIASLITAGVLTWAKTAPQIELPGLGVLAPWQMIFIIVGAPGLLLAVVFLFIKEPARREVKQPGEKTGLGTMFGHVRAHPIPFFGIVGLAGSMIIVAYSHGWLAASFQRTWGWSAGKYAFVNAIVLLSVAPLTVNFAGWWSDRLYQKGIEDAPYRILLIGVAILIPSGVLANLMPSGELAMAVFAINTFGIALASAVGVTALLNIAPSKISAQMVALYYMIVSLAGSLFGPTTVSFFSDHVYGNENLNYAVAMVPLIFGVPALLFGLYAKRAYVAELKRMNGFS